MNRSVSLAALLLNAALLAQDPAPVAGGGASVPGDMPAKSEVETPKVDPTKPMPSRDAADALTEEELAQVVDLLRNNYIRPDSLTELGVARAGVQGLLDRLGAGARVYSKVTRAAEEPSPLRSETLDGGIGYLRLGTLSDLGALDAALDQFSTKPPGAMILDLRATSHSTDFELAAEVCRRFAPKGRILFSIKRPKVNDEEILTSREDPRWRGLLVVLVDRDTAGAGEVIAAVLRTHLRAYIIGQQTQGEAAQFEDLSLPSGKILRVAIGEVTLPDNSPVFPGGLRPDLTISVTQEKTNQVLAAALSNGVTSLVVDKLRPRMNEAALVAGTNPELDAVQEQQAKKEKGAVANPALRDEVLQRAVDYVTAVRIFESARAKR